MIKIPADSIVLHRTTPFLAQLIACGLVGRAEALSALLRGVSFAKSSPDGRQARLAHAVDTFVADNRSRIKAATMIRRAISPLLVAGAPKLILVAEASRVAGRVLCHQEIEQLITDAVAHYLRIKRCRPAESQ